MVWVQTDAGWGRFDVKGCDSIGRPRLVPRDTHKTLFWDTDTVWESLRVKATNG